MKPSHVIAILVSLSMLLVAACGGGSGGGGNVLSLPGAIVRVSVDSTGVEGNGGSDDSIVSSDGRYVAYRSKATNLVTGDVNGFSDIFIHDSLTGATTRVSVDSVGAEGIRGSSSPDISDNGRYVAFGSSASNLVKGDVNGASDIFVHDTQNGTTTRASVDSAGIANNGGSFEPSISANGRYVAFVTDSILVAGDVNGFADIVIHDNQTGNTTRASVDNTGLGANDDCDYPSISGTGRYVAFESLASNLVTADGNGLTDIFVHDTQTGMTTRVSVNGAGVESNGDSGKAALSADGRFVAFESRASNLVIGDTNGTWDVFVHDTQTGATIRASVNSMGTASNGQSNRPSISANGRYVTFVSAASNLVIGDINLTGDTFTHDTQTGITARVSVDSTGNEGKSSSASGDISADGRYVVFPSSAKLVTGDNNRSPDVFLTPNPLFVP